MQQNNTGNSLYTGGVRYITDDEETSCVKCGLDSDKARALRLLPPTIPKPGYIYCPHCGPDAYKADEYDPSPRDEARRITNEIHAAFLEDTQRGERGGGGGGGGRRREKKPGEKIRIRYEQEWAGFALVNGNSYGELDASVTVTQYRKATERLNLSLPAELKTQMEHVATAAECDLSELVRAALDTHLASNEQPASIETGGRVSVQVRIYEDQRTLIDLAAEQWNSTKSDIAAHCCVRYLRRA